LSNRAKHPFVSVNCNAVTPTLFESEVFGHERGAFTGAGGSRQGLFERANQGVLFLDEIGDLGVEMQLKLLRFLEERRIQRVGGRQEVAVDVKVVAATNRDLGEAIKQGKFRKELFYRLNGFSIKPPQLAEHPEDILDLVRYFLGQIQQIEARGPLSIRREAVQFLEKQTWPGNVRELKNTVHGAVLHAEGEPIGLSHIELAYEPPKETAKDAKDKRRAGGDSPTDLLERASSGEIGDAYHRYLGQEALRMIRKAMAVALGSKAKAAKLLGMRRGTLRQKLREFGL